MVSRQVQIAAVVAGGVLGLILLVGAGLYAADYGVEATITDKSHRSPDCFVVATTHLGGIDVHRDLSCAKALAVQEGYFVVYHVRSGTTEIYTSEGGDLIYRG